MLQAHATGIAAAEGRKRPDFVLKLYRMLKECLGVARESRPATGRQTRQTSGQGAPTRGSAALETAHSTARTAGIN